MTPVRTYEGRILGIQAFLQAYHKTMIPTLQIVIYS